MSFIFFNGKTKRESLKAEETKIQNVLPYEQSHLDIIDLSKMAFTIQGKNPNNQGEWTDYTLYVDAYVGPSRTARTVTSYRRIS